MEVFHDIGYINMQLGEMSKDFGIYIIEILENLVERFWKNSVRKSSAKYIPSKQQSICWSIVWTQRIRIAFTNITLRFLMLKPCKAVLRNIILQTRRTVHPKPICRQQRHKPSPMPDGHGLFKHNLTRKHTRGLFTIAGEAAFQQTRRQSEDSCWSNLK